MRIPTAATTTDLVLRRREAASKDAIERSNRIYYPAESSRAQNASNASSEA